MGVRLNAVHLLAGTLPPFAKRSAQTLLTLGVQDCYFTYEELVRFLERHRLPFQPVAPGDRRLTTGFRWLAAADRVQYRDCVHQSTLFRALGFATTNIRAMDVSDYEAAEVVHDLNVPVDESLNGAFDVIFDGGTIEHIFSTKDALFNICRMSRLGGTVIHMSPIDLINHGFINVSAELLRDCYSANGFEEVALKYIAVPKDPRRADEHYLEYCPEEYVMSMSPYYMTVVYSVYRKIQDKPLTVPTQGAYRRLFASGTSDGAPRTGVLRRLLLRPVVRSLDAHFGSAVLVRSYQAKWKGRRVRL